MTTIFPTFSDNSLFSD